MFSLPLPLLLTVSVITSFLMSFLRGLFSKNISSRNIDLLFYNFLQNGVCTLAVAVIFLLSGGFGSFGLYSAFLGVLMGLAVAFSLQFNIQAYTVGPFAYTTVIVALGAVIPTLSGPAFFGDAPLTAAQWIGIVLMIVCIILSPDKSKQSDEKKANVKWLVLSVGASVINGLVGVIQKIHQTDNSVKEQMPALLLCCFATATVASLCVYLNEKRKLGNTISKSNAKQMLKLPILTGIVLAFPHTINLWVAGVLPTAVMFPIVNLCPMMLSMVCAVAVLKEKLSKSQWLGIAIGIVSTVLLSGVISF